MSTCAVEIRQRGIKRPYLKLFRVISGMSQRLSPKRPLCCPQVYLLYALIVATALIGPKRVKKQLLCNNERGELAEALLCKRAGN